MTKRAVLNAFRRFAEPELRKLDFAGRRGHLVRRTRETVQVVELQHSIYGGRITANIGIDLVALKPLVRWIAPPVVGPHAHDCARWIRIGLLCPDATDRWWSFSTEDNEGCDRASRGLGRAIVEFGVPWLERESDRSAFLRHARERWEHSRTVERPHGSYLELRLLAAVLAWNESYAEARAFAERAQGSWEEARDRLATARHHYRDKYQTSAPVPRVPDLQRELERLISPAKAPRGGARLRTVRGSRTERRGRSRG